MFKKNLSFLFALTSTFFLSISTCYAFGSFGGQVNVACAPETPYVGNCATCHGASFSEKTAAKDAYIAGGTTLTDFFCPSGSACTDSDGDTFSVEGSECGPVDCNDTDPAINPSAVENCSDGLDNDCDNLIDSEDGDAVGCPPVCTDNDGDTYAVEGGECGLVDCDDTDAAVNPAAEENCMDSIDNNCNDLVDSMDDTAVNCPLECTDDDIDGYALEGGECGPIDCNDADGGTNPGSGEICDDGVDNDCDGSIDEGCDPTCPDADGDGFLDATCGGADCNDSDAGINPGVAEVCGNAVDENCNGASDAECQSCPEGGLLIIKETKYNYEKNRLDVKGKSHVETLLTLINAQTGDILADDIQVKGGKWKVRLNDLDHADAPEFVEVINSDGCFTDKQVKMENRPEIDEEDEDDEDDEDEKDD